MILKLVQYTPAWEDKKNNKVKIEVICGNKTSSEPGVLIFPEMTLTGFTMNVYENFSRIDGEDFFFFASLAVKTNNHIMAGIIERDDNKYFNSLLHISNNGELVAKYRKIHPFSYSGEHIKFSPGNKPVITEIDNWKIGLSVCYDLRFPELYRYYAKQRVDLMIDIANWPVRRIEHWKALVRARAIENQCYFAAVNRTGKDSNGYDHNGNSAVIGPSGIEIAEFDETPDKIIEAKIFTEEVKLVREKMPFLNDIKLI